MKPLHERLLDAGIPVIVCTPHTEHFTGCAQDCAREHDHRTGCAEDCDRELNEPSGWNTITAAQARRKISAYRPGIDTLAMVGGHGIDVLDIDTKAGGDPDAVPANLQAFGRTRTPSGGWHFPVPSTGYGKGDLYIDGQYQGDYVGGTKEGGSRLLAYLPGSTRPKYPDAQYVEVDEWNIDALLSAQPGPTLLAICAASVLSDTGKPGNRAVTSAQAKAFLAEHTDPVDCAYGKAALAGIIEDAQRIVPRDKKRGRHAWACRSINRVVELMKAGCLDASAVAAVAEELHRRKPEGGTSIDGLLTWAIANADGATGCERHGAIAEYVNSLTLSPVPPDAAPELQPTPEPVDRFEIDVRIEAHRLRVLEAAKARVRAEAQPVVEPFDAGLLVDVAARPQESAWRIHGLLPAKGNATVVAQRKAGKTTLKLGLARSLLTGEPFLGSFATEPLDGRVAYLNYEVSGHQIARWAVEAGVPGDRLLLINLRGRRNPLADPEDRERLVCLLRENDVQSIFVDPFGRAFTRAKQNDPGEVGAFLAELDALAHDSGAESVVLAVHAGWDRERSRGSTALEDWPDVIMNLTRDDDTGHRYFRALGRDVDIEEDRLDFDPATRALTMSGAGNRKVARDDARRDVVKAALLSTVTAEPGLSVDDLTERLRSAGIGLQRGDLSAAAVALASAGVIERRKEGRAVRHYVVETGSIPTSPDESRQVPAGGNNKSRPVPIGRELLKESSKPIGPGAPESHEAAVATVLDLLGGEVMA